MWENGNDTAQKVLDSSLLTHNKKKTQWAPGQLKIEKKEKKQKQNK